MRFAATFFLLGLVLASSGCISSIEAPDESEEAENIYGVENVSDDWNSSNADHVFQAYLRVSEQVDREGIDQAQNFVHSQSSLNQQSQEDLESEGSSVQSISHSFIRRLSAEDLKAFSEDDFESNEEVFEDVAAFAFSRTIRTDRENIPAEASQHEVPDILGAEFEALMVKDDGNWFVMNERQLNPGESHSDAETREEEHESEEESRDDGQQVEDLFEDEEEQELQDNITLVEASESEIDQEVVLTGDVFDWRPDEMSFEEGETVRLSIESEELDHDFEFTNETESVFVPEGEEESITVNFNETGDYEFRCAVHGPGGMKGTVTVE